MNEKELNSLCKLHTTPPGWTFDAYHRPDAYDVMFRLHDGKMVIPYSMAFEAVEADPKNAVLAAYKELKACVVSAIERLQTAVAGMS